MGALFFSVAVLIALSHVPGVFRLAVARLGGMRIDRVVVGVGTIFRRGRWVIGAIPICTFVVIGGRDASLQPTRPALFSDRPWPWKLLVLLAGPIAFYLLSAALMSVSYVSFGVPVEGHRPIVGGVREGKPAARAGLQAGDKILAVDHRPMNDTTEVAPAISGGGATVLIEIERDGVRREFTVAPEERRIGIEIWEEEAYAKAPLGSAIGEGVRFPLRYTAFIVRTFTDVFIGKTRAEFSGPVGLVQVQQKQVSRGTQATLAIVAIYCVYFGFYFLWPLPLFDGGRLLEYLARRRATVEPRDLGQVAPPAGRIPAALIVALLFFALATLWFTLQRQPEPAILFGLIAVGLGMRRAPAWTLARSFALLSVIGAPLYFWLSAKQARSWFGLTCGACQGDARPVLAEKHHFACLRCGSTWVSRS